MRSEGGSAILEFVAFILIGQLLVFATSMTIASSFTSKVELQIEASQAARTIALGRDFHVSPGVVLTRQDCGSRLICLTLERGNLRVSAVNYK